jgi:hypothetical protein
MGVLRAVPHSRGLVLGGTWLRVVTWWRSSELDAALAVGTDPTASNALSLRAGQLRSPGTRARLARSLQAALDLAADDLSHLICPPPIVRYSEVRACESLVHDLLARLEESRPLSVQGLALTSLLVRDGASPLFCEHSAVSLAEDLRLAAESL